MEAEVKNEAEGQELIKDIKKEKSYSCFYTDFYCGDFTIEKIEEPEVDYKGVWLHEYTDYPEQNKKNPDNRGFVVRIPCHREVQVSTSVRAEVENKSEALELIEAIKKNKNYIDSGYIFVENEAPDFIEEIDFTEEIDFNNIKLIKNS